VDDGAMASRRHGERLEWALVTATYSHGTMSRSCRQLEGRTRLPLSARADRLTMGG
jgi:hypothetical protein